jgi:uncharacterized membrane protein (TIGR02234 family)
MRRLALGLWLAGAFVVLISAPVTWWEVSLTNGSILPVRGSDLSALAATLIAVSAAAFGASTLFRGVARRFVSGLSGAAALGAGLVAVPEISQPERAVLADITSQTGIAGIGALDSVVAVAGGNWVFVALGGVVLMTLGGVLGVFSPDAPHRASRYERNTQGSGDGDPVATWDTLTDGIDPTKR